MALDSPGAVPATLVTRHYYNSSNDLVETDTPAGGADLFQYDGSHGVITATQLLQANPGSGCSHFLVGRQPHALRPHVCQYTLVWNGQVHQRDAFGQEVATIDGRGLDNLTTVTTGAPSYPIGTPPAATPGSCQPPGLTCATKYTRTSAYNTSGDLASASTPPLTTTLNGVQSTAPVTTSYGYDGDGNQISMTSANGFTTTTSYDHLGRPITTTLPAVTLYTGQQTQPVQSTRYDGDGNVVRQVDGNNDVTTSSYDPLGRLVATTSPVNGTTLYTYTATEKAQAQDPRGNVTTYSYDAAGRQTLSTDQLGDTTQTQYDAASNPLTVTTSSVGAGTPLPVEARQYDALNRVVTDTLSGAPGQPSLMTLTGYDADGNVFQVDQPDGNVTFDEYDLADRLTSEGLSPGLLSDPSQATGSAYNTYTYDNAGNLTALNDADQRSQLASYDGANRLLQSVAVTNSTTLTTTPSFDPDGTTLTQTVQTQMGSGPVSTRVSTTTVNAADWATSTGDGPATGAPLVTVYQYDGAGQQRNESVITTTLPVTSVLNGDGLATAIGESVSSAQPYTSSFGYTPNDLPLTATLPGGTGVQERRATTAPTA